MSPLSKDEIMIMPASSNWMQPVVVTVDQSHHSSSELSPSFRISFDNNIGSLFVFQAGVDTSAGHADFHLPPDDCLLEEGSNPDCGSLVQNSLSNFTRK